MGFTYARVGPCQKQLASTSPSAVAFTSGTAAAGSALTVGLLVSDTGSPAVTVLPTITGFTLVYSSGVQASGIYALWKKVAVGGETGFSIVPANANDTLFIGGIVEESFTVAAGEVLTVDDSDSAEGSDGTPVGPSLTATSTAESIIAFCFNIGGAAVISAGSGFTSRDNSTDIIPCMIETKTGVNASQTAAFTLDTPDAWVVLEILLRVRQSNRIVIMPEFGFAG